tara:strand:- start:191 stop:457 length:267 start_codon:yes stop_codon:yes gene_type:complete
MNFFKKYKYVFVFCLTISLIVIFQEHIFNLFVKNINWRIIRIISNFFDDSVKWSDDLFRILNKSRKALVGIFSGLLGYLFYKNGNNKD